MSSLFKKFYIRMSSTTSDCKVIFIILYSTDLPYFVAFNIYENEFVCLYFCVRIDHTLGSKKPQRV